MLHIPADTTLMAIVNLEDRMAHGMTETHLIRQILMKGKLNAGIELEYPNTALSPGLGDKGIGIVTGLSLIHILFPISQRATG